MNPDLEEEIQVLEAIFGTDSISHQVIIADNSSPGSSATALVEVAFNCSEEGFSVRFRCPHQYPSSAEPAVSVSFAQRRSPDFNALIHRRVDELLRTHTGEVVMHSVIELVKSIVQDEADGMLQMHITSADGTGIEGSLMASIGLGGGGVAEEGVQGYGEDDDAGQERGEGEPYHWDNESDLGSSGEARCEDDEDAIEIIHGEPMTERASVFQSHFARVRSLEDVARFRRTLLMDKKVARATHNIFAFRFTHPVTGVVYHDCDDDGECAAGGRLAEILRLMQADGVAVTVSRWFGGVLLGPSRFRLINNCARRLLEERARDCIMLPQGAGREGGGGGESHGKHSSKRR